MKIFDESYALKLKNKQKKESVILWICVALCIVSCTLITVYYAVIGKALTMSIDIALTFATCVYSIYYVSARAERKRIFKLYDKAQGISESIHGTFISVKEVTREKLTFLQFLFENDNETFGVYILKDLSPTPPKKGTETHLQTVGNLATEVNYETP